MKVNYSLILGVLVLLMYSLTSSATDTDQLDLALKSIKKEHHIPAMSIAVIRSGKLIFSRGYGFIDEAKNKPVSADTLFRVASISKLFTAQAVVQLVEAGKIELDDPVAKYLRAFDNKSVTIKQLLTHSSGLKDSIKPKAGREQRSKAQFLKILNNSPQPGDSGKVFEYSDSGFNLLGMVVEAVSGESYEERIEQFIFRPLEMHASGYYNSHTAIIAQAQPSYKGVVIGKENQRAHSAIFNPSEGLVSNTKDLASWLTATMRHSPLLMKAETYQSMLEPNIATNWGNIQMGLGWQVYLDGGVRAARHPGGIRGYKSLILMYPEEQSALVILTNSSSAPRWVLANAIIEILDLKMKKSNSKTK